MGFTATYSQQYDSVSLFTTIKNALQTNGTTQWFSQVGPPDAEASASGATVIASLLQTTVATDAYLSTDSTQVYYIYLLGTLGASHTTYAQNGAATTSKVVTQAQIFWGTSQNFTIPAGATDASQVVISPLTPSMTIWEQTPGANSGGVFVPNPNGSSDISNFTGGAMPLPQNAYTAILTITNRGFVLACFSNNQINAIEYNSFICIQRPINPNNGTPKTQGTAPVFALFRDATIIGGANPSATSSNNDPDTMGFSVVRESDINVSTTSVQTASTILTDSTSTNPNTMACFYRQALDWPHPNSFDNLSHVIKIPFSFITSRHLYMDEMDLICLVDAVTFNSGQTISITMYQESSARIYTATFGDCYFGNTDTTYSTFTRDIESGARVGILTTGLGI